MIARDRRDVERPQPVVQFRARDRRDRLVIELPGEDVEAAVKIVHVPLARTVCFFRRDKFIDQLHSRARLLARCQVSNEKLRGVFQRFAVGAQPVFAFLRHDAERRWKLRALDTVAFQLSVLECCE